MPMQNMYQPVQNAQKKVQKPKEEKTVETPNMPSLYPSIPIMEETGILIAVDEILAEKRLRHIESFIQQNPEVLKTASGSAPILKGDF